MFIVNYTSSSYTEGSDHPIISSNMFAFKSLLEAHSKIQQTLGEYMSEPKYVIRSVNMDTNCVGTLSFISEFDNGKKCFHEIHMYVCELKDDGNLTWTTQI